MKKTFLAHKRPEKFKVFQFTKEMLPEMGEKLKMYYIKENNHKKKCMFYIYKKKVCCYLVKPYDDVEFEVGDYIGEDKKGYYFIIKKEEFERDWIKV